MTLIPKHIFTVTELSQILEEIIPKHTQQASDSRIDTTEIFKKAMDSHLIDPEILRKQNIQLEQAIMRKVYHASLVLRADCRIYQQNIDAVEQFDKKLRQVEHKFKQDEGYDQIRKETAILFQQVKEIKEEITGMEPIHSARDKALERLDDAMVSYDSELQQAADRMSSLTESYKNLNVELAASRMNSNDVKVTYTHLIEATTGQADAYTHLIEATTGQTDAYTRLSEALTGQTGALERLNQLYEEQSAFYEGCKKQLQEIREERREIRKEYEKINRQRNLEMEHFGKAVKNLKQQQEIRKQREKEVEQWRITKEKEMHEEAEKRLKEMKERREEWLQKQQRFEKIVAKVMVGDVQDLIEELLGTNEEEPRTSEECQQIAKDQQKIAEDQKTIGEGFPQIAKDQQQIAEDQKTIGEGFQQIAKDQETIGEGFQQIAKDQQQIAKDQKTIGEGFQQIAKDQQQIAKDQKAIGEGFQQIAKDQKTIGEGFQQIAKDQKTIGEGFQQIAKDQQAIKKDFEMMRSKINNIQQSDVQDKIKLAELEKQCLKALEQTNALIARCKGTSTPAAESIVKANSVVPENKPPQMERPSTQENRLVNQSKMLGRFSIQPKVQTGSMLVWLWSLVFFKMREKFTFLRR